MSVAIRQFNLTQYSELRQERQLCRQLEFQYCKVQDQNRDLRGRLETVEEMYRKSLKEWRSKEAAWREREEGKQREGELVEERIDGIGYKIDAIRQQLGKFHKMGIDTGCPPDQNNSDLPSDPLISELTRIQTCLLSLLNRNSQLSLSYSKQLQACRGELRLYHRVQQQLKEELSYLSGELQKSQKTNVSLANELNLTRRENKDLKLKVYEYGEASNLTQSRVEDEAIEDNSFTVDLLHFQKELLERTFEKIIAGIENQSLVSILTEIYEGCASVGEVYREKLQIQYDLQDLQQEYRKEKNSKVSEKLLIQLRKQIEEFRHQLQRQKDVQGREEMALEELFLVLRGTEREQKQVRTYAVDVHKQLQELKGIAQTKAVKETKRHSSSSSVRQSSRIRFKASESGQQEMREALRRDRDNIQKMFKQTRRTYLKGIDG